MVELLLSFIRGMLKMWAKSARAPGYLYRFVENWGHYLQGSQSLRAILPTGMIMECNLRDHVQRHIYFFGVYEPIEAMLYMRLIRPGMVVVDAGANVGQYTLLASHAVGPQGWVHSFEPVPWTFELLSRHVEKNHLKNVRLNSLALWKETGFVSLGLPTLEEVNFGSYSVGGNKGNIIRAEAITLDEYVKSNRIDRIDLIKIDIEGSEWATLQGMSFVLARDRPIIMMEINRDACRSCEYDPQVFWDFLRGNLGYRAWMIGHSAEKWRELETADGINRANVLFLVGELPEKLSTGWTHRTALRWASRRGLPSK
jgi:FkbM family methyltransferase